MGATLNNQIEWIQNSIGFLLPELLITSLLVVTITIGLINKDQFHLLKIISALTYLVCAFLIVNEWPGNPVNLLNGMLRVDDFSACFKLLFLAGGLISILISEITEKRNASEYFTLLHSITLGSCLLAMSMNFILVLLALELISLSSYVLTGFNKGSKAAEGSMKYFLFGAVATSVMIYGLSILYGQSGTLYFASEGFVSTLINHSSPLILIAGLFVMAGILYKISAAPFHLWTPDVYESAPTPVVAFFSVVPKLAGFSLLIKFTLTINLFGQSTHDWQMIIGVIATLSILIGNLSALAQHNIKRMMAYSSIAQSGFLMIGLVTFSNQGIHFLIFYSVVFLLANFIIFISIQEFERKSTEGTFTSLSGMGTSFLFTAVLSLIGLISLTGLPPTAGFTGKLFLFSSLWESYEQTNKDILIWLLVIGLINTVISLFFYLKIPYYLFLKKGPAAEPEKQFTLGKAISSILAILLIYLFLQPSTLMNWIGKIGFIL